MHHIMLHNYVEQLCEAFRDGICITDRHGVIILVNRKHAEITGVAREDILGKNALALVKDGVFDVVLNPEVVQSRQTVVRVQTTARGRKLVLEGHPVLEPDGEVGCVITFIRDVTTLSELREQLNSQKELLEAFQQMNNGDPDKLVKYPRVVNSQTMRRLYGEAAAIAETDATVLLLGETGVGKDVVARRIHAASPRAGKPFIKVDCGSIPENLIETELFGYTAGSFSGASKNGKAGLIEAANEGTLFLDEIGELPMSMQSRLLRVLQDWEVLRVGSTAPRRVDVRIVAATNKDLEKEVQKGRFRSDLYYRLKVAVLKIPPLNQRKADILPLAHSFLGYYNNKYRKQVSLSPEAEQSLLAYAWPGNVRELENCIQGLVVTSKKEVLDAADLPTGERHAADPAQDITSLPLDGRSLKDIMRELEDRVIRAGMKRYGSLSEAARNFQVDRSTLFRKVKALEKEDGRKG